MIVVDADELYGLPLERFVPERTALVRTLRSAGEREEAAAVAALRKPSVAAWTVNQLVRTRGREVEALLRAGDALRGAQAGVVAGSADARDLRSAAERERAAVDDLVQTARGLLTSGGQELSATTLERVADTLHAAALDDEARSQVSEGRLVREVRHVGLGVGGGEAAGPAPAPSAPSRGADASRRGEKAGRTADKQRRAAEAAHQREREDARKQARANERDAAREVERAERALHSAQDRRARAAEALRQAEEAVAEAQAGCEAAIAARRRAKQQLDNL
ncbi:MAG: hypothetical protein ACJ780_28905 [Solirubrobacteraceae bacterium]